MSAADVIGYAFICGLSLISALALYAMLKMAGDE